MTDNKMHPGKLLEISGCYWQACTLQAGVKLGLFTRLGQGRLTSQEMAEACACDPDAMDRLLNGLAAMGLLIKKEEAFANSEAAQAYLSKDSPEYIGHMIMHHHHLVPSWARLDEAVKSGRPVRTGSFEDKQWRESFLMGMFNNAMLIAPELVSHVDVSDRKHLLDLGGGPGTYAIHFCLNNPGLRSTVLDLPETRPFAERIIDRFQLGDRISFVSGDYVREDLPGKYDAAWLSHVLHGEGPDDCRRIIEKTESVLEPGGKIIIHDFILDDTRDGPFFPALFSLNMLLGTDGGRSYSEQELMQMLKEAGFRDIARLPYIGPTESGLITGTKP
ncbi:MAG: methyltransferase domain-containing protein [Desulfohalobiaceae bacterium]|nr:methyltransferase domain-containing protein [Desulfohalobiaceae bacterium]